MHPFILFLLYALFAPSLGAQSGYDQTGGLVVEDDNPCTIAAKAVKALDGPHATLYSFLNVDGQANLEEIKQAYRNISRTQHPDKVRGDVAAATKRYALVNDVYALLKDEKQREKCDKVIPKALVIPQAAPQKNILWLLGLWVVCPLIWHLFVSNRVPRFGRTQPELYAIEAPVHIMVAAVNKPGSRLKADAHVQDINEETAG